MSKHGETIAALLVGLETIAGNRVHEDHVPQLELEPDAEFPPYIFFTNDSTAREETLDERGAPGIWSYSIECIAVDGGLASQMAELVAELDGARDAIEGLDSLIFIDEQSSDYVPRGLRLDVGSAVKSLALELHVIGGCPTWPQQLSAPAPEQP